MEILAIVIPDAWVFSESLDPAQLLAVERTAQKLKSEKVKSPDALFAGTAFPLIQAADVVHDVFGAKLRAVGWVDQGQFENIPAKCTRVFLVLSAVVARTLPETARQIRVGKDSV
jgi:hypothetical protein